MRVKVYLVLRNTSGGGVEVLAARLTQGMADHIASGIPGAYTTRTYATKEPELVPEEQEAIRRAS